MIDYGLKLRHVGLHDGFSRAVEVTPFRGGLDHAGFVLEIDECP